MTAPQTLLNKIQKAHEMNNENAALLTVNAGSDYASAVTSNSSKGERAGF